METEGEHVSGVGWVAAPGSRFAHLSPEDVARLQAEAETHAHFREADTCTCDPDAAEPCPYHRDRHRHAPWADHHPVARAVWEAQGLRPGGSA